MSSVWVWRSVGNEVRSSFILEKWDKVSATTFSEVEMWEVRRPTGFRIRRVA